MTYEDRQPRTEEPGGPHPGMIAHALPDAEPGTAPTASRLDQETVAVGTVVVTADDRVIGSVKETEGQFIHIDAPMQRDFWLDKDLGLAGMQGGRIVLSVTESELDAYRLKRPAPQDDMVGTDEQERQRRIMESELERQREERDTADHDESPV